MAGPGSGGPSGSLSLMTFLPGLSQPAPPTMVVWNSAMTAYNFGPGHPMAPARLDLTARLASSLGLLDFAHVSVEAPEVASDTELETVHSPEFVAAVRRVSDDPTSPGEARRPGRAGSWSVPSSRGSSTAVAPAQPAAGTVATTPSWPHRPGSATRYIDRSSGGRAMLS